MVEETELRIEGNYIVHPAGKVIGSLCYFTTEDKVGIAEKILREEFRLVDDNVRVGLPEEEIKFVNLVYERGPEKDTGIAHFHLFYRCPEGPHISFHHWLDRMIPEDFGKDALSPILEKLYLAIRPAQVTGRMGIPLKEKLLWEK